MNQVEYTELREGKHYRVLHRHVHVMDSPDPPYISPDTPIADLAAELGKSICHTLKRFDVFFVLKRIALPVSGAASPWYQVYCDGIIGYVNSIALAPTVKEVNEHSVLEPPRE